MIWRSIRLSAMPSSNWPKACTSSTARIRRKVMPKPAGDKFAGRIAELPQMRLAGLDRGLGTPTGGGRLGAAPIGIGLHAGRPAILIALGLAIAFALGYLAARL